MVARLLDVELVADAGAERRDQRLDLLVLQDLVDPRLLDVEDLAAQRQHGLRRAVAALLGRAAGGVALDDEELGQRRVLTEQSASLPGRREFSSADLRRSGRGPCARPRGPARPRPPCVMIRVAPPSGSPRGTPPSPRLTIDATKPSHAAGCRAWSSSGPRTAGRASLTEMTAVRPSRTSSPARLSSFSLSRPLLAGVAVERAGQRGAEAGQVRAALVGVDVVGEARRSTPGRRSSTASRPRPRPPRSRPRRRRPCAGSGPCSR